MWLAEIRFCPALHTLEGLSEEEVVRAVTAGFARARRDTGIEGGIILCAPRPHAPAASASPAVPALMPARPTAVACRAVRLTSQGLRHRPAALRQVCAALQARTAPGVQPRTAPGVLPRTAPGVQPHAAPGVQARTAPGALHTGVS